MARLTLLLFIVASMIFISQAGPVHEKVSRMFNKT